MSDQLRSIFARWQTLEEQKAETSSGLKDLFTEAKGNGFSPKELRVAFRRKAKEDEPISDTDQASSALVETYLAALGTPIAITRDARQPTTVLIMPKPAAPVKAAAEDREPVVTSTPASQEAGDAPRKESMAGGSRHDSWMMQEDIPANLRRVG